MWQIISTYIGIVIMTIGVSVFQRIVLNEPIKITIKKLLILISLISIIHVIMYFKLDGTTKSIIMCILNTWICQYTFKISIKKSIFITFLYMIILFVPDLIQLFFVTHILGLSRDFCYNTLAGSLISNFGVCALFIFITYIFRKPLRKLVSQKIENNTKIIIFVILIFICTLMFFYTLIKEFRFSDNVIIYLVAIIVLLLVLFSLIKQTIENNKLTKEYEQLLDFMTTYEEEIEKQRILRHETKNEFLTIRAKLSDNEKEQAILKYIDEILKDKIVVKQEEYAKFGYLPPNGIKGLCYFKTQEAEKKNVKVALSISKRVKKSTIFNLDTKKQREFAKILGVFLDNAIEASSESKEKQLGIEAYVSNGNEFRMVITNTFNNEINTEKLGKERFSTKGKNRGHGLLLVDHIMKNNNRFETNSKIQGNIYVQTIIVKDLNNKEENEKED